jgi:alpha-L-arabinofuranosidase
MSGDMKARNSYANPGVIVPQANPKTVLKDGVLHAGVKKLSWNMFRVKLA